MKITESTTPFLTSHGSAFINVDVIETQIMTPLRPIWGGQVTTSIIRMFGKAVKFRHCPATVSAPDSRCVNPVTRIGR